ncbi:hypothetical protein [Candidatus Pelagibacter giovannonii]|nr:hypothetical protein [Candidatus Pelagibacter giovannonii]
MIKLIKGDKIILSFISSDFEKPKTTKPGKNQHCNKLNIPRNNI